MKSVMELSCAVVAVFLLGCLMCSCKELPRVEELEITPEMVAQFENTPETVAQLENAPEMVEQFENAPEMFEQLENAPAMVEQFEKVPEMFAELENMAAMEEELMQFAELEMALQQIDELQNAPEKPVPVVPVIPGKIDRPIKCWAGAPGKPFPLDCYTSCMNRYKDGKEIFFGCASAIQPSGCQTFPDGYKSCFCNKKLCNRK